MPAERDADQELIRRLGMEATFRPCWLNLFLHYGFDTWMARNFPAVQFERYVDDGVDRGADLRQAEMLRDAIGQRMVT